jgi:putative oxidoreductase
MSPLAAPTSRQINSGLTVLRIVVGLVFIAHGAQKFFVYGLGGTAGAFGRMGIPLPAVTAALVATVELVGGAALVVGLYTRIAALLLAADMLGAIALVHVKGGFFLPSGIEFALTLLAAAIPLLLAGAGEVAVDNVLRARRSTDVESRGTTMRRQA